MFKAAYTKPPFHRYQFRLGIGHIGLALRDADLYGEELSEAASLICSGMTGRGWVTFTWLEPELFYINTTNYYTSSLEINIDLPAYGARESKHGTELTDMIEMRSTGEGYELGLLTREQRYCWPDTTRDKGLVLFRLPYKFSGHCRAIRMRDTRRRRKFCRPPASPITLTPRSAARGTTRINMVRFGGGTYEGNY